MLPDNLLRILQKACSLIVSDKRVPSKVLGQVYTWAYNYAVIEDIANSVLLYQWIDHFLSSLPLPSISSPCLADLLATSNTLEEHSRLFISLFGFINDYLVHDLVHLSVESFISNPDDMKITTSVRTIKEVCSAYMKNQLLVIINELDFNNIVGNSIIFDNIAQDFSLKSSFVSLCAVLDIHFPDLALSLSNLIRDHVINLLISFDQLRKTYSLFKLYLLLNNSKSAFLRSFCDKQINSIVEKLFLNENHFEVINKVLGFVTSNSKAF
ncbi:hypothetical protein P9112_011257 [Eukaryota sp. TZLM1-RC]